MKLKYLFEAVDMEDEIIYVPVGKNADQVHGIIKLNREGQEIADLMKEETNEKCIIDTLAVKYDNDISELSNYVHKIVRILRNAGLIEE